MEYSWNPEKRTSNFKKHKIDFQDVPPMFDGPVLLSIDDREDYGEEREIAVGMVEGRVLVVVFTIRDEGETCWLISARKAEPHEQEEYFEATHNGASKARKD